MQVEITVKGSGQGEHASNGWGIGSRARHVAGRQGSEAGAGRRGD